MELIQFDSLHEKKKEKERVKALLEQGKMPIDNYIKALEELVEVQASCIEALRELNEAQADLIVECEKYIEFLKG